MKNLKIVAMPLLALLFVTSSCNKDEDDVQADSTDVAQEVAASFNMDEDIENMAVMGIEGDLDAKTSTIQSVYGKCATVTYDSTGTQHILTIDFGSQNCQGHDFRMRRGILVVRFEKRPFDPGSVYTITSNGYAVNDWEINGTKTVTYQGLNSNDQPYSDLTAELTITRPDGKVITWNSTRQRNWVEGFGDFNAANNVLSITGTASGTTASGVAFTTTITKGLRIESSCSNIVSGTLEISGPTFSTRTIDYGNGDCDRQATLSINGNTSTFLLR